MTNQASLWINGAYLSLIRRDDEDPLLDLTSGEHKAPCGNIRKTPHWEVPHGRMKDQDDRREDAEDQEEKNGRRPSGPSGP